MLGDLLEIPRALERIEHTLHTQTRALADLQQKATTMALDFTNLLTKVTRMETTQEGTVALLTAIATELRTIKDSGLDPQQVQRQLDDLASRIETDTQNLAAAVAANTPADAPAAGG